MQGETGAGTSFLIRIWWETSDEPGQGPEWRGRAEHVTSREVIYFKDLSALLAFVQRWAGNLGWRAAMREE